MQRPAAAEGAAAAAAGSLSCCRSGTLRGHGSLRRHRRLADSLTTARQLRLLVDARDGKRRRKKNAAESSEPKPPSTQPSPRRVNPDSIVSVTTQLGWVKSLKEYNRQQAPGYRKPPVPQAFRKETLDEEEYRRQREEQEAADREAARYKSDRITLQSMFNTTITAPGEQPTGVTLVDGYNLLFSMRRHSKRLEELLSAAETKQGGGHLEAAREYLLRGLDSYSGQEGMYVHVVLDAMRAGFCSEHNKLGMIVTFTSTMEADSMIMLKAQQYINQGVTKVVIVSNDRELTELGTGNITLRRPEQRVVACSCHTLAKLMHASQRREDASGLDAFGGRHRARAVQPLSSALRSLQQQLVQQEVAEGKHPFRSKP
ncbi:hypothetical protein D9Q98_006911 [Chlorella vulgaris]|uniref:NYN domain-containing protein n=1 Tax=Chlorella vulgaris TaxID=3077 RepID=A0A9D4TJ32_CHLVU|nr:hypothetical protein D9Q98_006911 [Chlorella vulgaris]